MEHVGPDASTGSAELDAVIRETRQAFVAQFAGQIESLAALARQSPADPSAVDAAVKVLHRIAGLGGTIGFRRVSQRAAELEGLLRGTVPDSARLTTLVDGLRQAYVEDQAELNPPAAAPRLTAAPLTVLLVEDDVVQRTISAAQIRRAGHTAVAVGSGEEALETVRTMRPDVILLDVELPGMSGYSVCRELKSNPALANVPLAFLTAHTSVEDRLAGLSHGADDFLTKPIDARELALRLQLLAKHRPPVVERSRDVLSYDAFVAAGGDVLSQGRGALALIRTPADKTSDVAMFIRDEIRRRDLCGEYDRTHVVVLMPDTSATAARQRVGGLVEKCLANGITGVYAGVAGTDRSGASVAELVEEADEALAVARYEKVSAALRPTAAVTEEPVTRVGPLVLIADDDPDVVRILDVHLAAGGYRRTVAFDGSRALEEVRAQRPAVLILDLMMPRLTGFDVLAGLRDLEGERPRIIVLSARGREDDVLRAFSFGADDFMAKPFNPQELLARVTRLVRK